MAELRGCTFPEDLLYHPDSHLWFSPEGDGVFRVGVTPFGVAIAGEILYFMPKPPGRLLEAGRSFGLLEAGKTVFSVKTPLEAELVAVNDSLSTSARGMNLEPYATWLVRLKPVASPPPGLIPWPQAREAIERQMVLWRFDHLADFRPPLFSDGVTGNLS